MIKESGRVIAIEPGSLWVETIQLSGCASCSARKGCGTSLLAKAGHQNFGHIRALLTDQQQASFSIGDTVDIGIEENVVAGGALFVYLFPLAGLLLGAALGDSSYLALGLARDLASITMGVIGLSIGGIVVRLHSHFSRNNRKFQPVVLSEMGRASQVIDVPSESAATKVSSLEI